VRRLPGFAAACAAAGLAGACATAAPVTPTASVAAVRETAPVASADDAADDPAIWRDAAHPERSLIVGTDKKAGLYVFGLDGAVKSRLADGRVNNVDLREAMIGGRPGVIVVASDRTDPAQAHLAVLSLAVESGGLTPLARLPAGPGEAYGLCLYRRGSDGAVFAFLVLKDGAVRQYALDLSQAEPAAREVRNFKLATQAEGCVADDRTGQLYVAEEDVGVWRIAADPAGGVRPEAFARVDGAALVADVEGVAIVPDGASGGWLVASSQGDSAYALYRLADGGFAGRFRIAAGSVDGTSETDGLEFAAGGLGPAFPDGLLVVQDGDNAPEAQNFKLVSWADVARALGLR
jgi:3-phytase